MTILGKSKRKTKLISILYSWNAQQVRGGHCRAATSLGFCLLVVSMCGCFDRDLSADPHIAGELAHHKFVTRQEAILFSKECSRGAWTYCDFVMPIAPQDMPMDSRTGLPFPRTFPPTLAAFEQDKTTWIARIRAWAVAGQPGLQADHTQVYGGLPVGTIVEIEQVMSIFDGENGRYWRVFAVIQSGEFAQRRVILPDGGGIPPAMLDWDFLERTSITPAPLMPDALDAPPKLSDRANK